MIIVPLSVVAYLMICLVIRQFELPRPRPYGMSFAGYVVGLLALLELFALWFVVSWRPLFALVSASITVAVITAISNYKYRQVGEPLTFVDFELIPQIWRHPALYQASFLHHPAFWAFVLGVFGIILGWCNLVEPNVLGNVSYFWVFMAAGLAGFILSVVAIIAPPPWLVRLASVAARHRDPNEDGRQCGLPSTLLSHFIMWQTGRPDIMGMTASERAPLDWVTIPADAKNAAPVVIVIQSESFVDLVGSGFDGPALPSLARARSMAVSHGRLTTPIQGAWTLRSEFVLLTGKPIQAYGLEGLNPYLRLAKRTVDTLAHQFQDAGFSTVFIHPFDMRFFRRDTAMPKLGFQRLIGEADLPNASRDGYFISDAYTGRIVRDLVASSNGALFCFIATMENHNPWEPSRLPHVHGAAGQYAHHLRNADTMLGELIDELEKCGRPAVLAFYGDHVPILPEVASPFPDPRTDYVVVQIGNARPGIEQDLSLSDLPALILKATRDCSQKE